MILIVDGNGATEQLIIKICRVSLFRFIGVYLKKEPFCRVGLMN